MSSWAIILFLIGSLGMVWLAIHTIRTNPQAFSKINLSKSLYTVGLLTLMILAIIAFCIIMLRS